MIIFNNVTNLLLFEIHFYDIDKMAFVVKDKKI